LTVQLPKPVRAFVDGFDAARYPEVLRLQTEAPGPTEPAAVAPT
jgi:hypothetical protein